MWTSNIHHACRQTTIYVQSSLWRQVLQLVQQSIILQVDIINSLFITEFLIIRSAQEHAIEERSVIRFILIRILHIVQNRSQELLIKTKHK